MKTLASTIITVVASFTATLLLNLAVQYFTLDRGALRIGPAVNIQGQNYFPIDNTFANYEVGEG